MNSRISIVGLLLLVLFSNCIDEIKLNIDTDRRSVAIEGLIGDELATYAIKLNFSAVIGVGNDNVLDPITGANVLVFDDAGNTFEFVESAESPGTYEKEMKGEAGRAYFTEIKLPDGRVIKSTPTVLLKAPSIDSVNARVVDEGQIGGNGNNVITQSRVEIAVSTEFTTEEKPFLRWRADGEYEFLEDYPDAISPKTCYIKTNVDLNKLKVFDTRTLAGNQINNELFLTATLDERFAFNFCFHIFQYAMNEAEFKYWDAVSDIINIDGSLFDPPPGTVKGNLFFEDNPDEVVVGYFSVNGVSSKRFFANPKSIGVLFVASSCRRRFNRTLPSECFDCTTIRNSSLIKPDYWNP